MTTLIVLALVLVSVLALLRYLAGRNAETTSKAQDPLPPAHPDIPVDVVQTVRERGLGFDLSKPMDAATIDYIRALGLQ